MRRSLPPGWEFWTVQAVVAITAVSVAVVAMREIDVRATDQQAGVDVVSARARAVVIHAIGGGALAFGSWLPWFPLHSESPVVTVDRDLICVDCAIGRRPRR